MSFVSDSVILGPRLSRFHARPAAAGDGRPGPRGSPAGQGGRGQVDGGELARLNLDGEGALFRLTMPIVVKL